MNNLEIYEKSRAVPLEAQKQFSNGKFSGTDINPMWRIKKLTELFGPAGIGWYTETISERSEQHGNVTMAIVDLNLYIKYEGEWSKPIFGTGGNILVNAKGGTSDEGYKMAYTDALGIACKALGIGADIWFCKDTTKYTNPNTDDLPFTDEPKEPEVRCERCGKAITPYMNSKGQTVTVEQHIAACDQKCAGMHLCLDCANEYMVLKKNAPAV